MDALSHKQIEEIGGLLRHELDGRFGLKKNGETWLRYAWRQVTVERIFLVVIVIFNFGGTVRAAKQQLTTATEVAQSASDKADAAAESARHASEDLHATQAQLNATLENLKGQVSQQAAFNAQVSDRLDMTITRSEFRSTIVQQVLPRLDRIEPLLDRISQRVWSGRE